MVSCLVAENAGNRALEEEIGSGSKGPDMSRTHKLITQIAQVCQELRAKMTNRSIKATRPNQLGTDRKNKGP